MDDATSTAASRKAGRYKRDRSSVKLRKRRGEELGEELGAELPSVAREDAELLRQCVPRSWETARVGSDNSSAHHSSTRRPKISEADPTDQVTDLEDKMHQVFAVLMQVTEGEANDIVCNLSGMGLEAWRKLTGRWNHLTASLLPSHLRHLISSGRASLTELLAHWSAGRSRFRSTGTPRTSRGGVETYQRTH